MNLIRRNPSTRKPSSFGKRGPGEVYIQQGIYHSVVYPGTKLNPVFRLLLHVISTPESVGQSTLYTPRNVRCGKMLRHLCLVFLRPSRKSTGPLSCSNLLQGVSVTGFTVNGKPQSLDSQTISRYSFLGISIPNIKSKPIVLLLKLQT